jgi:hypothetical protein
VSALNAVLHTRMHGRGPISATVQKTMDDRTANRDNAGMTSQSSVHDFLLPRLTALVDDAVATGVPRDVAVAVLIDLVTSPRFDTAAPDPEADSAPHPDYQRTPGIVLVHGMVPLGPLPIDAQDEADFVKPIGWSTPS